MGRHTDEYFFDTKKYADLVRVKLYRFELQHKDSSLYGYYSIADDKLFIGQKSTFGGIYLQGTSTSDDVESLVKKFYDDFLQKYSAYSLRLPPSYLNNELNTRFTDSLVKNYLHPIAEFHSWCPLCTDQKEQHFYTQL